MISDLKVRAIKFKRIDKEIVMRNMKSKLSFGCEILLGASVLAVLAGLGTAGYAATSRRNFRTLRSDQIRIFDPFTLSGTTVTAGEISDSDSVYSGRNISGKLESSRFHSHLIRIPFRPVLRSPFRPPSP